MPYLSEESLLRLGFSRLGSDVKISDKASIYEPHAIEIGDRVRIDDFCVISGKVTLGSNVHIAVFSNIHGGTAGVTFEDFSGLAYGCHVFAESDDYSGRSLPGPLVGEKFKTVIRAPVLARKHSIVGACSVIFPGVTLEEGTAIGAMSLVTKSTKPWSIYFGVPARRIRARDTAILALESQLLSELDERRRR